MLGAFQDRSFDERVVELNFGDQIILFSDGFSECELAGDNGEWAVETIRVKAREDSAALAGRLAAFAVSSGKPADDITVMVVRVAT